MQAGGRNMQVSGRLITPAALMLEMALAAGATLAASSAAPAGVSISAPLILPSVAAHSHVEASLGYAGALELHSTPHSSKSRWTSHCRGSFAAVSSASTGKHTACRPSQQLTLFLLTFHCTVGRALG